MVESDLPPSERGSVSRLIDAVDRLTEIMTTASKPVGVSPVNWWDVVPELDGKLVYNGYSQPIRLPLKDGSWVDAQLNCQADRLEISLRSADGRTLWQRCLYTRH